MVMMHSGQKKECYFFSRFHSRTTPVEGLIYEAIQSPHMLNPHLGIAGIKKFGPTVQ